MKRIITYLAATIFVLVGFLLLFLSNNGFISLRQPYIVRQGAALYPQTQPVAFTNVQVIPMDRQRVLEDQTVLVSDGIIQRIGPASEVSVPANVLVVDGQDKYLMPGLADMHVHVKEENELLLFAAHGVTTVRDMWGTTGMQLGLGYPDQLAMRAQVQADELFGPTIYTSGPVMEGEPKTNPMMNVFSSPQEASASVKQQKAQGYDFIKVYDYLTPEVYAAIIQAASEEGLPVVGHVPKQVGLEQALASGQATIEHLSGYIDSDSAAYLVPEARLAEYAALTREAGTWVCPTIGVYQKHVTEAELGALESLPEMGYVSPSMKILWRRMLRPGAMQNISYQGDYPARIDDLFTYTTRVLHENGVRFILGTDTDNPYLVPGASLLDELDYLIAAGFSPYEALATGTSNPAEALGRLDEFGTVSEGKRADLILLAGNPLEDIKQVRNREGVMIRGHWLPEDTLQGMLAALVHSYAPSLLDRLWPVSFVALGIWLVVRRKRQRVQSPASGRAVQGQLQTINA